jgi:hypothetical protein
VSLGEGIRARAFPRRVVRLALMERDWALVGLGVLQVLAYCSFFIVMHLKSRSWAPGQVLDPLEGYWRWFYQTLFSEEQVMASRRSAAAAAHPFLMLASVALISGMYLLLLYWFRRSSQPPRLRVLMSLAVLASLPLLFLPNLLSGDVYSYIAYGRVAAVHGGNPFIDPPSTFAIDPLYRWVYWKHEPSVYGPSWIYLSIVLTILVNSINQHVITYVLAYKLLAFGLHLVNGWLIWAILGRWKPEQQGWGTALYLLSPLALIEFVGNAHNDALMITFILLGIWFHLSKHWYWTIAAFTLGVLTKWIALPLLPLYGLSLLWDSQTWRERGWKTMGSLVIFASLCVSLYRPYWEGSDTLKILFTAVPQQRLINSLGDVLSNDIQHSMWRFSDWPHPALVDMPSVFNGPVGRVPSGTKYSEEMQTDVWTRQMEQFSRDKTIFRQQQSIARNNRDWINGKLRTGALAILGLSCLIAVALSRNFTAALAAGAWIFFMYCTIGAVWFWPWYVTWFVALAALLDWRVTGRAALLLSLLVPLIYIFYPTLPDPIWWQYYRAVMIFVPPLLFAGWHGVRIVREAWRGWRLGRVQILAEA